MAKQLPRVRYAQNLAVRLWAGKRLGRQLRALNPESKAKVDNTANRKHPSGNGGGF